MSKIKNGALDQYGAEHFERQQFGTAGIEGFNKTNYLVIIIMLLTNTNATDQSQLSISENRQKLRRFYFGRENPPTKIIRFLSHDGFYLTIKMDRRNRPIYRFSPTSSYAVVWLRVTRINVLGFNF